MRKSLSGVNCSKEKEEGTIRRRGKKRVKRVGLPGVTWSEACLLKTVRYRACLSGSGMQRGDGVIGRNVMRNMPAARNDRRKSI